MIKTLAVLALFYFAGDMVFSCARLIYYRVKYRKDQPKRKIVF